MKQVLTIIFTVLLFFGTKAQEKPIVFGEVDPGIVSMKVYPNDSSTDAVVLYDLANVNFEYDKYNIDLYVKYVYHRRIKILKKTAFNLATVTNQIRSKNEFVKNIKGFTYNMVDGKLIIDKLNNDMIFFKKSSSHTSTSSFILPNVKEGSVIDFMYEIYTPVHYPNNPKTWAFQGKNPIEWSELKISIPNFYKYKLQLGGYLPLFINEAKIENSDLKIEGKSTHETHYRFVVKDAPAFKDIDFVTNETDFITKIGFGVESDNQLRSYKPYNLMYVHLNEGLLETNTFGTALKRTGLWKNAAIQLKKQSKDTTELIQLAKNHIRSTIKWNKKVSMYVDCSEIKKVLKRGEGSSGDMNIGLICLLRKMGFEANPVILGTRDNGKISEEYAFLDKFNYIVGHMRVNDKDYFLDATDEFLSPGMLPINCLNHSGYLVHPTENRFISLETNDKDQEISMANFKISENGEMNGNVSKAHGGYNGLRFRKTFKEEGKEKLIENIKNSRPNWKIKRTIFENETDNLKSFEEKHELSLIDYITLVGDMMYLKPMISEANVVNEFKEKDRMYPIDLTYPIEKSFTAIYELPKGYQIVEIPKTISLQLPDGAGKFSYFISETESVLSVFSKLSIKKVHHAADKYVSFKDFYDKIIQKHAEQVVLKKVK